MNREVKVVVGLFSQVAMGAVLLYAGIQKVFFAGAAGFFKDLGNYQLAFLQAPWDEMIAFGLPWLEIIVGLCLIADFCRAGAGVCAFVLSTVFLAVVSYAWMRGIDLRCGCFGKSIESVYYPTKVASLVLMMVGSALAVLWGRGRGAFYQMRVAD
jgi:putative oxidoreductase